GGNGAVLVDAMDGAAGVFDACGVAALEVIADGQPEFSVGTKIESASEVTAGVVTLGVLPEDHLAGRVCPTGQTAGVVHVGEPRDARALAVGPALRRVEEIDVRRG